MLYMWHMGTYKEKLLAGTPRVTSSEQTIGYTAASITGSRKRRRQGSSAKDNRIQSSSKYYG